MSTIDTTDTTTPTPAVRTRRIFMHGTMRLSDPGQTMTPEQVKAHYAASYPDLANATVSLKESKNGTETFEFKRAVATKG
jgi:PRTRC genetic system protein C